MFPLDITIIPVLLLLATGAYLSVRSRKLTPAAGVGAFVVGLCIYAGGGYSGLGMLAAFFIMATAATAHGKQVKAQLEGKKKHPERRKLGQVLANGGVAAALGLLICAFPRYSDKLAIMMAGALSSATADTLASELGMIYGRNAFNILSLKREAKGLDGVISIEGTLLGIAGSVVIALIYSLAAGFDAGIPVIIIAGTLGNLSDSVLGASLERKHVLNNDGVNVLNTLIAAIAALVLMLL